MTSIDGVRPMRMDEAPAVAAIHAAELADGLLARLGPHFLGDFYYRRVVAWPTAFCLVYEYQGRITGFVAGTADWQHLFRAVSARHPGALVGSAARALVREPRRGRAFAEAAAFMARTPAVGTDAPGEILSLAVSEPFRSLAFMQQTGVRIGRELGSAALAALRRLGTQRVRALVRADNTMGNVFYRNLGFEAREDVRIFGGMSRLYIRELAA